MVAHFLRIAIQHYTHVVTGELKGFIQEGQKQSGVVLVNSIK